MVNKAVVLGNNYYIALSVLRGLGIQGVHTVAVDYAKKNTYAADSKYCDEHLISPHYQEDPEGFIEFLINFAKRQNYKPVLLPCHDSYVEIVDQYLYKLKEYYLIPQTEQGLYINTMDKEKLHRLAEEHGVLVPETVRLNEDHFYEKIDQEIGYPCIVKPTDSPQFTKVFNCKSFEVNNRVELDEAIKKATDAELDVVVQRIIPGFDDHMHTFDCYLDQNGEITHWTTAQKLRQYPINFGASVYTHQKYFPELYDMSKKFLQGIGFKGFVEIEYKKDANTGDFYLIELNVRFTNFDALLRKVGLNFPYITYRDLIGKPLQPKAVKRSTGIVFWYFFEDMKAIKDYLKTNQLTKRQVIKSLFKRKAHAVWDLKDPRPFMSFWLIRIKRKLS
ncbi:carboxylate--amine ligase [Aquisalibacillus elongatus]|uniref:Putative ATP-grasp superfamily ATP-dependent carboligase n=1 Tax=Aquisalibacillus elongatus TaxID=485577 RepID=A0A3N5B1N1_9BACI|nr:carboxylate--amine ligase [Aquisalibacillus elongatus]RPF51059.1 putative ATP-grasp superfamily ATP-dependent carboligase [Aquisalibacillus elongatus]